MKTQGNLYQQLDLAVQQRIVRSLADERGQTTAEYALVLLAAGTVAMLVVAWAQDSNSIGSLFDSVMSKITGLMG